MWERDRNDFQEDSYLRLQEMRETTLRSRWPIPPLRIAVEVKDASVALLFHHEQLYRNIRLASRKVVKSSCIFIKGLKVISFTQGEYHPLSVDLPKNKVKSLLPIIHTPNLGTKFRITCMTYTVFAEFCLLVFSSAIYIS